MISIAFYQLAVHNLYNTVPHRRFYFHIKLQILLENHAIPFLRHLLKHAPKIEGQKEFETPTLPMPSSITTSRAVGAARSKHNRYTRLHSPSPVQSQIQTARPALCCMEREISPPDHGRPGLLPMAHRRTIPKLTKSRSPRSTLL